MKLYCTKGLLMMYFLLFCNTTYGQGTFNKNILVKNIEQYVAINYDLIQNLYENNRGPLNKKTYDSISVAVDSTSICLYGYMKNPTQKSSIIYCLYEGYNNEIFNFVFGDLNNDGTSDAVVTFTIEGFYGGNGYGRFHALFLSDEWGTSIESISYVYPAIEIESIAKGIVYASQVGWSDDDGRCCPSLRRDVIYNYENKALRIIKEFEYKTFPKE